MPNNINIKTLRESFDVKRKELADRLGINVRTLDNYEKKGEIPPYMQKLIHYEFYTTSADGKELALLKQEIKYLKDLNKLHEDRIRTLESELAECRGK